MRGLCRAEPGVVARPRDPAVPVVEGRVVLVVIVLEHGDLRLVDRVLHGGERVPLPGEGLQFREAPVRRVGVVVQAVPVDLQAHRAGPPAEVAHHVGAVRHGLQAPEPQLPRLRHRRLHAVRPAVGARLLLHDPEGRRDRAGPGEVPAPLAVEQVALGGAVIHVVREVRVRVERDEVETALGHQLVVVEVGEQAVGGDPDPVGEVAAEDLGLHPRERDGAAREEAALLQLEVRVDRAVEPLPCQANLLPVAVPAAPESGAERLVQRVERAELPLQVGAERVMVAVGEELGDLAVELVVDLPPDDRRVRAVVRGDPLDDARRERAILRRVVAVVAARAVEGVALAVAVEDAGVVVLHPDRRGRRRGAEDHVHPEPLADGQEVVEVADLERAVVGLQQPPGELGDAQRVEPVLEHARDVVLPERPVPVLRVVGDSESPIGVTHVSPQCVWWVVREWWRAG